MNGLNVKCYSKSKDGKTKLSDNFTVKEFACSDGSDPVFISMDLVKILQEVRNHFKKPVHINSGYRTASHNKKVDGAAYSQHVYGLAADIKVGSGKSQVPPKQVAEFVETLMPKKGGIGIYTTFTHVDVRKVRSRWNG